MDHEFFVSTVFNDYIVHPVAQLFGYRTEHEVLPAHVVMILLVSAGLMAFAVWFRRRLSVDSPGNLQQTLELFAEWLAGMTDEIVGHGGRRYFPLVGALFLYIIVSNLLGLVPGFMSPTSNINVTLSCAVIVFIYYNFVGIRDNGFGKYLAHFAGPSLIIAPLLFPIEILSHLARPFSLSVRLFGNIFAEELIVGILNSMFPFLISIPVMALAVFASTVQAFIFVVLTMVYLGGAVEHAHEGDGPGHSEVEESGHS
ncbi:MAG TPA: F0F1 ATP synthase subunit A [Acidobacteriota bacterium]|nr:F0F1 ATP synthase subunit A [Acidobacteriota bacterium]